jgi:2-hydroxychromene-2-carboxylate isomerase
MRVYFDFVSPYAYVAWQMLPAIAARHGRSLVPVPVVFGALLAEHGTLGPAEVPAKRSYLLKDVYRKAHRAAVPFVLPPTHPFNPLLALRVASLPMDEGSRRKLVDALFTATWGNGRGVESPEAVAHAASAGGLDGDALVRAAQAPEAKARLRAQTDEAIAADVFGVPTVAVDGELFWGVDSLEALDAFLEGRDPVPGELVAAWDALPSSVTRRGE